MIDTEIKKNRFIFLNILDFWSINAVIIALLVVAPILSVFVIALNPTENIWPHLVSTTLPRYASNTIILMCFVGFLAGVLGTTTAWLIARYNFWGRNGYNGPYFFRLLFPLM